MYFTIDLFDEFIAKYNSPNFTNFYKKVRDNIILNNGRIEEMYKGRLRAIREAESKGNSPDTVIGTEYIEEADVTVYVTPLFFVQVKKGFACAKNGKILVDGMFAYLPEYVKLFIVYHEIAHITHNHSGPRNMDQEFVADEFAATRITADKAIESLKYISHHVNDLEIPERINHLTKEKNRLDLLYSIIKLRESI